MNKFWKILTIVSGSLLLLAAAAGVLFFGLAGSASAQESSAVAGHSGPGGFPGDRGPVDSYLADALGVSVEELQAAQDEAVANALDKAVEEGLLSEEQAEILKNRAETGLGRFGHGLKAGLIGADFDPQSLLAEALDISLEELQAAQQAAQEARLAAAVKTGFLTQEQADLLQARAALQSFIDPQALQAEALGIGVEELQAYREQGLSRLELLDQLDLTVDEVRQAYQAAYQAAVADAVAEGVITQEQADQLGEMPGAGFGPGFGPGGRGGHGGRGGPGFPGDRPNWDEAPGTITDTGLDA